MTGYFFHPLAESELLDAARFYEGRSTGLGRSFLAAIRRAIEQILLIRRLCLPSAAACGVWLSPGFLSV